MFGYFFTKFAGTANYRYLFHQHKYRPDKVIECLNEYLWFPGGRLFCGKNKKIL